MAQDKPQTEQDLHNWGMTMVDDGKGARRAWEGIWWENIATYCGDLWSEWDPHKRRLWDPVPKPRHKVRLPINLAQPTVRTEKAKLVKNKPIVDVQATQDDLEHLNAAKVGDSMLNNYAERTFHLPKIRRRALDWTLICGYGGVFVDYDDTLGTPIEVYQGPEGTITDQRVITAYQKQKKKNPDRLSLDKAQIPQGDLVVKQFSPFQLMWDFSEIYLEDATWCIYTDVLDTNYVEKRWKKEVEPETDISPGTIEKRLLARFDKTSSLQFNPPKGQDLVKVHRLFVKPGHPYFPDGLHMVFCEECVIRKENFPFEHGELPFASMGHIPFPISQFPMSVLQQVKPPVLELSKTESQMVENRNLMSNPGWMIPQGANIEGEIVNKPGMMLKYRPGPNGQKPEIIEPPEIPQYVKDLVENFKDHIQQISGQGETSQGQVPPGARSGVAIAYLQEQDDTRLGPTVSEFEEMNERMGWLILETMAEKYDIPRTVTLYRKHGEPEVLDFVGTMIQGKISVNVQAGSALPRSKAAKQQFILDLWDRKLEQDPRKVREMLELGQGEPDEWQIDLDQAERENRKLLAGEPVEVKEWHNHPAHHYIHRQYMKSADFDEKPDDVKARFEAHDAEHTAEEQKQAAEMAWQQQQGAGGAPTPEPTTNGTQPGAEGQQVPEGPPAQFTPGESPASALDAGPQ